MSDYFIETTTGEKIPLVPGQFSIDQIDELLGRVLNEDVGGGVFWAEYGVTTAAEIITAVNAGKFCVASINGTVYVLAYTSGTSYARFVQTSSYIGNSSTTTLECSGSSWRSWYVTNEMTSDKVQEISSEDATSKYPSSPAVQAYVEANKQLFKAIVDVTTIDEVVEAYNAGKVCFAYSAGRTFILEQILTISSGEDTSYAAYFTGLANAQRDMVDGQIVESFAVPKYVLHSAGWALSYVRGELETNKVQSISEQSTDTQYPSAKAVYTYGQNIDTAAQGYANAAEEAAKDYTDEQLEPVAAAAGKAEDYALKAYVSPTASGAIASFDDGAENIHVKSLVVDIEPVQAGTGEPSPENVRPISGWTGVKVQRTGKNLFPRDSITSEGPSSTGIPISLPAGKYTFSGIASAEGGITVSWTYSDDNTRDDNTALFSAGSFSLPLQIEREVYRIGVYVNTAMTISELQIESSATATSYEPYQGDTYDISFPDEAGTVYGGTLDVTSGVLTVDRAMKVFSGDSSEGWYKSDYGYFITARISDAINHDAEQSDFQSNLFAYGYVANESATLGGCLIWGCVRVRLADMSISLDEWKAQLATTPMQVVYTLANPIEITLTPTQIATLLGTNNIWADTGDTEVTYRADPTLIYNKLTAAIISSGGTV